MAHLLQHNLLVLVLMQFEFLMLCKHIPLLYQMHLQPQYYCFQHIPYYQH